MSSSETTSLMPLPVGFAKRRKLTSMSMLTGIWLWLSSPWKVKALEAGVVIWARAIVGSNVMIVVIAISTWIVFMGSLLC